MDLVSVLMLTLAVQEGSLAEAASQPLSAPSAQVQEVDVEQSVPAEVPAVPAAKVVATKPSELPADDAEVIALGRQKLQQNDIRSAIELFDDVLQQNPKNEEARKAKGHALVLLGDAYGRMGKEDLQMRAYREAFETDSSLADDQSFIDRYSGRAAIAQPAAQPAKPTAQAQPSRARKFGGTAKATPPPVRIPPRQDRWIGMQLHLGPEALGGIGITFLLFQHLQISGTADFLFPAVDAEAKILFLKSAWTPFVSAGYHFQIGGFKKVPGFEQFQSNFFHVAIGAQYFHSTGFFLNLGISWLPPVAPRNPEANWSVLWPHASIGWVLKMDEKAPERSATPKKS